MKKCFIELDEQNYVIAWTDEKYSEAAIKVGASDEVYGVLGYVKYVNNNFEVDEEKKRKIISNSTEKSSDIEILKKENEELRHNQEIQNEAIAELGEMIAMLGGE